MELRINADVCCSVCEFLTAAEVVTFSRTSKTLRYMCTRPQLWERLFYRDAPSEACTMLQLMVSGTQSPPNHTILKNCPLYLKGDVGKALCKDAEEWRLRNINWVNVYSLFALTTSFKACSWFLQVVPLSYCRIYKMSHHRTKVGHLQSARHRNATAETAQLLGFRFFRHSADIRFMPLPSDCVDVAARTAEARVALDLFRATHRMMYFDIFVAYLNGAFALLLGANLLYFRLSAPVSSLLERIDAGGRALIPTSISSNSYAATLGDYFKDLPAGVEKSKHLLIISYHQNPEQFRGVLSLPIASWRVFQDVTTGSFAAVSWGMIALRAYRNATCSRFTTQMLLRKVWKPLVVGSVIETLVVDALLVFSTFTGTPFLLKLYNPVANSFLPYIAPLYVFIECLTAALSYNMGYETKVKRTFTGFVVLSAFRRAPLRRMGFHVARSFFSLFGSKVRARLVPAAVSESARGDRTALIGMFISVVGLSIFRTMCTQSYDQLLHKDVADVEHNVFSCCLGPKEKKSVRDAPSLEARLAALQAPLKRARRQHLMDLFCTFVFHFATLATAVAIGIGERSMFRGMAWKMMLTLIIELATIVQSFALE